MTYTWEAIKLHVARKISEALSTEALKVEVGIEDLGKPPDAKLGDMAFGCFKASKQLGKSPAVKRFAENVGGFGGQLRSVGEM